MGTDQWADGIVRDAGRGLRRAGGTMMIGGALLCLVGVTTLTLAYSTYSGYRIQAGLAVLLGGGLLGWGWSVLRRGDRLGPALVVFARRPLHAGPVPAAPTRRSTPNPRPARIHVQLLPLGELPPAGR